MLLVFLQFTVLACITREELFRGCRCHRDTETSWVSPGCCEPPWTEVCDEEEGRREPLIHDSSPFMK